MINQMNSTDSMELELVKESLRKDVSLAEDLEGLLKDERFQRVFVRNFCTDVVIEETKKLISPNEVIRESSLEKIKAAKYLEAYIDYVADCGIAAKADLAEGIR